jgi:hypothetical protein
MNRIIQNLAGDNDPLNLWYRFIEPVTEGYTSDWRTRQALFQRLLRLLA